VTSVSGALVMGTFHFFNTVTAKFTWNYQQYYWVTLVMWPKRSLCYDQILCMSENTRYNYGKILIWLAKLGEARSIACLTGPDLGDPRLAPQCLNGSAAYARPTWVLAANGISIASAGFAGLTRWQTDRSTDHATWLVTMGGAHSGEAKFCYCLWLATTSIYWSRWLKYTMNVFAS